MRKIIAVSNCFLMFLASIRGLEIPSPVDGTVTRRYFEPFDQVEGGDYLLEISYGVETLRLMAPYRVGERNGAGDRLWSITSIKTPGSEVKKQQVVAVLEDL